MLDHFHVIQHVGKALKKVIGRHVKKEAGKQALEGQRYLFLRNQEDLSTEEEHSRTALALAFPEIAMAWQLKEALRTWYATTSASTAARDAGSLDSQRQRAGAQGNAHRLVCHMPLAARNSGLF